MRQFLLNNLIFICSILLIVLGFIRGKSLGLVKKVMSLIMLVASIIVTRIATPYVVVMVKDVTNIESTISDMIYEILITTNLFDGKLNIDAYNSIKGTEGLIENMKNTIAINVTSVLLNLMCGIVVFIVTFILFKIIFRLLDIIDYVPVIGDFNRFMGGVFGAGESVIMIWLIFAIVRALDTNIPLVNKIVEQINQNFFVNFLYQHNIVFNFFQSLFLAIKK